MALFDGDIVLELDLIDGFEDSQTVALKRIRSGYFAWSFERTFKELTTEWIPTSLRASWSRWTRISPVMPCSTSDRASSKS